MERATELNKGRLTNCGFQLPALIGYLLFYSNLISQNEFQREGEMNMEVLSTHKTGHTWVLKLCDFQWFSTKLMLEYKLTIMHSNHLYALWQRVIGLHSEFVYITELKKKLSKKNVLRQFKKQRKSVLKLKVLPASVGKLQELDVQHSWLKAVFVKPRFTDHSVGVLRGVTQASADEQFLFTLTVETESVTATVTRGRTVKEYISRIKLSFCPYHVS